MKYRKRIVILAFRSTDGATYHKSWGDQRCQPGHWVVVGPDGDVYGCDAIVFHETYEPVDGNSHAYRKRAIVDAQQLAVNTTIQTLEGEAHGRVGDWLVTNPTGETYVVPQKVFMETYEAVHSEEM